MILVTFWIKTKTIHPILMLSGAFCKITIWCTNNNNKKGNAAYSPCNIIKKNYLLHGTPSHTLSSLFSPPPLCFVKCILVAWKLVKWGVWMPIYVKMFFLYLVRWKDTFQTKRCIPYCHLLIYHQGLIGWQRWGPRVGAPNENCRSLRNVRNVSTAYVVMYLTLWLK